LESAFFVIVGAALNLFLDFDRIEGAEQKMQNTWNGITDGLMITLVWLYIIFKITLKTEQ
jgi:uncharacterized YccA/Bax inhibitor family protein